MKSIIGHRNPDTDTICSAIAHQAYLAIKNVEAQAFALGNVNNETRFVLEKFGVEIPEVIQELPHGSEVILVDHNEEGQSIDNLNDLDIVEIIDHHKVKLQTDKPIRIHVEPLGSSCSIVAKRFFSRKMEIPQEIAQIMVAGIISDTLYFRSPTTTPKDRELVARLNEIAQIKDLDAFSREMFDAKSDVKDLSTEELVRLDYKKFNFSGHHFGIGVMETTNPNSGLERKEEILEILKKIKETDEMEAVYFSVVDILEEKFYTLCSDEEAKKLFVDIFKSEDQNGTLYNDGIVSRKKQVTPGFENYFNK
jgi:manganese-dependent inorganic pyrophosphatase